MRLGGTVFNWGKDPALFAQKHVEKGFTAAVCPDFLNAGDTAMNTLFVRELEQRGILFAEVGAWCNPLSRDQKLAEQNIEHMIERLALAEELGAKTCVNILGTYTGKSWYGPHPDNYSADFFAQAVDVARRLVDAVKPKRTTLSFEMMPYNFLDHPKAYCKFLKAVDRPGVAVHFDPCNCINSPHLYCHITQFLEEAFALFGSQIVSVHLKDIALLDEPVTAMFQEVLPGAGHMDYHTLLRCLNRLDSDTPAIIEHLPDEQSFDAAAAYISEVQASL